MNNFAVRITTKYEFDIINYLMLDSNIKYSFDELITETGKLWIINNYRVDNYVSLKEYLIQNDYQEVTVEEYLDLNEIIYYYTLDDFLFINNIHPKLYWINKNTNQVGYDDENTIRFFDNTIYIYFRDIDKYLIYINTIINKNNLNKQANE